MPPGGSPVGWGSGSRVGSAVGSGVGDEGVGVGSGVGEDGVGVGVGSGEAGFVGVGVGELGVVGVAGLEEVPGVVAGLLATVGGRGGGVAELGGEISSGKLSGGELAGEEMTSTAMSFSVAAVDRSPMPMREIGTKINKWRISDPTMAFDHKNGESLCCHWRIWGEGEGDSEGGEEGITTARNGDRRSIASEIDRPTIEWGKIRSRSRSIPGRFWVELQQFLKE